MVLAGGALHHVFHVHQRKALWCLAEVAHRVVAGSEDPAAIHLEDHKLRIGEAQQFVVDDHATLRDEFRPVVVNAEGHSGGLHLFPDSIELAGNPATVVERQFASSPSGRDARLLPTNK